MGTIAPDYGDPAGTGMMKIAIRTADLKKAESLLESTVVPGTGDEVPRRTKGLFALGICCSVAGIVLPSVLFGSLTIALGFLLFIAGLIIVGFQFGFRK